MIDPRLLRGAFRVGVFIAGVAILTLPFQPPGSAEFVVTVLAAVVGGTFVIGIALLTRWGQGPPHDKRDGKGYTTPARRRRP